MQIMNDILFSKKIKEREAEQLRSSSAQRLIDKLSLLSNRREASRKRWFCCKTQVIITIALMSNL